jgi:tetratricopeptide (TPR) repeat protein
MERHRAAAEWIESLSPDRSEDRAEMLAHHYREALSLAGAAGLDPEPFREPAFRALTDASERAAALSAWNTAAELAAEALALARDDDARRPDLQLRLARARGYGAADIDVELAEVARDAFIAQGRVAEATGAEVFLAWATWWTGDGEAARSHAKASLELARNLPTSIAKASAWARAGRSEGIGGDPTRAVTLANETLAMAEELDSDDLRSDALNTRGIAKAKLDDQTGIDDLRRSVELADASNVPNQMATARNNLASVLATFGRVRETAGVCVEAVDIGMRFGNLGSTQFPAMQLIQNKVVLGDPTALGDGEELLEQASPNSVVRLGVAGLLGSVYAALGRFAEAEPLIEESLAAARLARDAQAVMPALVAKLSLLVFSGRSAEANAVADELVSTPEFFDPSFFGEISLHLAELGREKDWLAAEPQFRRTPWTEVGTAVATGEFVRAAELYEAIGAEFSEAWACLLAAERGDISQLEPARAFFASFGAAPFLARCDAVMAASA